MPHAAPGKYRFAAISLILITGSLGVLLYGLWQEHRISLPGWIPEYSPPSAAIDKPATYIADYDDDDVFTSTTVELLSEVDDVATTTSVFVLDEITTGPSGQVSGYVLNELNEPVAGAELRLLPLPMFGAIVRDHPALEPYRELAREEAVASTKSERDGYYVFEKLELGRYEIFAEHKEYAPSWESSFILLDGETLPGVDIRLAKGIPLEGRVTDPNGNPIEKALVRVNLRMKRLIATGGEYVYVLFPYDYESSDSSGNFLLKGLSTGENVITVSKQGWYPAEIVRTIKKLDAGAPLKVTLQPASEIGGIVTGPDDSVIVDATVTLKAMYDRAGEALTLPGKALSAKTYLDGRFYLLPLPRDVTLDLLVEKSGLPSSQFYGLEAGTLNNRLQLTAGGQISGAVIDADTNDPVPGIKAILTRLPKPPDIPFSPVHTATGPDGRYLFWGLPEGSYRIDLDSLDWVSTPRDNLDLKRDQQRAGIDFDVYQPITLTGRVVNMETDSGIPRARVTARGFYGPAYKKSRESKIVADENGNFTFKDLLSGQWRLTAESAGFFFNPTDRSNMVWLKRGEASPTDIVLEMEPAGELSGVVYNSSGYPVEKATVVIDHGRKKTETNSSGEFSYNDINVSKALTIRAYAWKKGFAPGRSEPVILSPSQRRQTIDLELPPGFEIEGLVVDEDDLPIARANVRLSQHNFDSFIGEVNQEARTNAQGEFFFAPVSPGSVTVAASAEGRAGASRRLTLGDDGDYPKIVLQLRRGFEIAGTVRDDLGQPIEGASVTALGVPGLGNVSATSDRDGSFVIKNLREGEFPIQCVYTRNHENAKYVYRDKLPIIATGSAPVRFTLPVNGTVEGTVFSAESMEPIPSFTVEFIAKCAQTDGGTYDFGVGKGFTSGYGRFFMTYLPTGVYNIRVSATGFVPATRENITITSQSQRDIGDIFLETAGGLKGLVIDSATGNGVSGARVAAAGKAANTDYSGFFQLTGLAKGSYSLRVTGPAHLPFDTQPFSVREGEVDDVGRIYLEPGATAKGRVVTAAGEGAPNMTIQAQSPKTSRSGKSDAAGYYELQGLSPGQANFLVTGRIGAHNLRQRFAAQLLAGVDNQLNFTMDNSFDLSGELTGLPPLSAAAVTLFPLGLDGDPANAWAINGAAGLAPAAFSVSGILNGRYLLCWRGRLGLPDTAGQSGDVRWLQVVDVQSRKSFLTITPGVRAIAGDVVSGATAELQSGVKVRLAKTDLPGGGGSIPAECFTWNTVTDDNGSYEFTLLPTGRYRITFTTADERQFFTDVLLTAADTVVDLDVEF